MAGSVLPDTLLLRSSRRKWLALVALAAPLLAGGLILVLNGDEALVGWLCLLFFGACEAVFIYQLIVPGWLALDADGFEQTLMGRKLACRWTEVSAFGVYGIGHGPLFSNKFVCFDRTQDDGKAIASINRALAGASAQLGDSFGMKAVELAELMNAFRDRALEARQPE